MTNHLFNARAHLTPNTGSSRRDFLKQSASATAAIASGLSISLPAFSEPLSKNPIAANPIGFNAERQDHITQKYHFGNGVRMYNPSLMRFHASDSMSPFGKGGINSYAYALGDPVNHRDPSGHIAITSIITGIIVGAVIGASIAAVAEGIKVAVTGGKFDWKQVVIGAVLGAIGGGFGAAASGASLGIKAGLALGEAAFSGLVDFGLNVAAGTPVRDAAINAGIGALIGLVTFAFGQIKYKQLFKSAKHSDKFGGERLGKFLLYRANPGEITDELIVTAHGVTNPFASRFKAGSTMHYYSPHGTILIDPDLTTFARRAYRPYKTVTQGKNVHNYLLSNYQIDNSSILDIAQRSNIDIISVKPKSITTSHQLDKVLKKNKLNYSSIHLNHCRARTRNSPSVDALLEMTTF